MLLISTSVDMIDCGAVPHLNTSNVINKHGKTL